MKVPVPTIRPHKTGRVEKFNRVLDQYKSGQSIEDNAAVFEAPNRDQGGDLGFFRLDQLSPQLQEHLIRLNAGDVTPILSTDQGFQVFYVEAVETGEDKTLEKAAAEIQDQHKEIVDTKFQAWLEALKRRSHIKIALVVPGFSVLKNRIFRKTTPFPGR